MLIAFFWVRPCLQYNNYCTLNLAGFLNFYIRSYKWTHSKRLVLQHWDRESWLHAQTFTKLVYTYEGSRLHHTGSEVEVWYLWWLTVCEVCPYVDIAHSRTESAIFTEQKLDCSEVQQELLKTLTIPNTVCVQYLFAENKYRGQRGLTIVIQGRIDRRRRERACNCVYDVYTQMNGPKYRS